LKSRTATKDQQLVRDFSASLEQTVAKELGNKTFTDSSS